MIHPDVEHTMLAGYPRRDYLEYERFVRQCDECNAGMNEGYLHEVSGDCFCSSDCAAKKLPDMDELLEDGTLFWTDWYCEI